MPRLHPERTMAAVKGQAEFDLTTYLRRRREEVDAALDRMLPPESAPPPRIHQAMRYAVFAGGKRIRPILVLAGCEAAGGDPARAMPFACAVECIHTYSLIHDDLPALDNDDLRRGRATVHRAFDEATAVLAGDALLTFAYEAALTAACTETAGSGGGELAAEDGESPTARAGPPEGGRAGTRLDPVAATLQALRVLTAAIGTMGMIGGQVEDIVATGAPVTEELVLSIHGKKTGALLRACPVIGGILAGAGDEAIRRLGDYGSDLGLAFQIVDDILDIEGSAESLGKTAGKDAAAGKATFPAAIGIEASRARAGELARSAAASAAALGPAARPLVDLVGFVVRRRA
jgi:geranylgeranyl diphosphate synthase type II